MRKIIAFIVLLVMMFGLIGCDIPESNKQQAQESKMVNQQQKQYSARQPIPSFEWSLERHLVIELYKMRNRKVATHTVWRSDMGVIEGDCTSMGFSIPYDTSLTNPIMATTVYQDGDDRINGAMTSIEQPEPNGLFSSKNTSATWVLCTDPQGNINPVYVESHVTSYPYPVKVDYETNRVIKAGSSSVTIKPK